MLDQTCKDETCLSTCDSESFQHPNIYSSPSPSKKQKRTSDRYLPLRKISSTPSKQLIMNEFELKLESASSEKAKQFSLADYYEIGILGKKTSNLDAQINSFSNNNSLKFIQTQDQNKPEYSFPQDYLNLSSLSPKKGSKRKINKKPIKVLDAPELADDFYSNLLDWSSNNLIIVGLADIVYIYNPISLKTAKLAELSSFQFVYSVSSCQNSNLIAVGTSTDKVQLWDCFKNAKLRTFYGHKDRVGTLSWNNENIFASGSKDKSILIRDIRQPVSFVGRLIGHKEQICGLKWSDDKHQLASGGNDNKINIWNIQSTIPSATLTKHVSAVRALAWSPHQHGLLASGGGVNDKTIRFWNSLTGQQVKCFPSSSQVCSLIFSKNTNQLVSTHGYTLNEINIWKLPNLQKLETITGHKSRVLHLAMNPSGTDLVTGAGKKDECINIWNVFPETENYCGNLQSNLMAQSLSLR